MSAPSPRGSHQPSQQELDDVAPGEQEVSAISHPEHDPSPSVSLHAQDFDKAVPPRSAAAAGKVEQNCHQRIRRPARPACEDAGCCPADRHTTERTQGVWTACDECGQNWWCVVSERDWMDEPVTWVCSGGCDNGWDDEEEPDLG